MKIDMSSVSELAKRMRSKAEVSEYDSDVLEDGAAALEAMAQEISELNSSVTTYLTERNLARDAIQRYRNQVEQQAQRIASVEEKFDDERATTMQLQAKVHQQAQRIAELEKDAARYRWLRDPECYPRDGYRSGETLMVLEYLDAAIDAAMLEGGR